MASLPIITCSQFSSSRPKTLLSRPRQLLQVRCNAQNDNNTPHLDRRNLLLGMGGLYGSTNLDSPALATPISAPDLAKCTLATNLFNGQPIPESCCPPLSDKIIDYKLPKVQTMRVRPAAHLVTQDYIDKYNKAVELMKGYPDDDPRSFKQQANVHCAYCNLTYPQTGDSDIKLQIHHSWLFFPWHRWYLYFYERILGNLIGDPTFGLPFWNWDHPDGMFMPNMFDKEGTPAYDEFRNQAHRPGAGSRTSTADLRYDGNDHPKRPPRRTIRRNLQEMYGEMVSNSRRLYDFYGAKYVTGTPTDPGEGTVERGSHTALHRWVGDPRQPTGEDMGNFYSAGREPIFFSHHANIDRLWSVYRDLRAKRGRPRQFKQREWLDADFVFYDENAQLVRVRVEDTLENEAMGYKFQKVDNPWLSYREERVRDQKKKPKKATNNVRSLLKKKVSDEAVNFPVKLDKIVQVLVDRPKKSRSKEEKEKEEELLVIEGIEVDTSKFVRFEVYVNDEDDKPDEEADKAEYAGCYSQVPHKSSGEVMKTKIRLGLSEVMEDLDADDDDQILVTLVPQAGGDEVTIGGIKIIYDDVDED
ncbi:hypothetical protein CASFOL_025713 [Castilleja foliolosa]|uniref:Tyrosinase copper-binding domain-containing protein n=1 Tax=Castilleja foliolosa TaxID=1961234 RepID=A0ABD3CT32_9LAMI